jgi:hypothetical protein
LEEGEEIMPEPFLIAKAADMSVTALGKATSVVIKGLIVLSLIALIVWSCYVTFIKPHTNPTPTQMQKAGQIVNNNNYYESKNSFFVGVKLFGFKLGLSK